MFKVDTTAFPDLPSVSGEFKNRSVILGANGSGKSTLMNWIYDAVRTQRICLGFEPVVIEGGRAFKDLPSNVSYGGENTQIFSQPSYHKQQYLSTNSPNLRTRLQQTFGVLKALEQEEKQTHSDLVDDWCESGKIGDCPLRNEPPLSRVFRLFNDIFPNLTVFEMSNKNLYAKTANKPDSPFTLHNLSDGEKQVLVLLADLAGMNRQKSIFLIDEPELNLHPTLADRFWTFIEDEYPDCIFLYATHNFPFACRSQIESRYIMGYGNVDEEELWTSPESTIKPFWGAIPLMAKHQKYLFVEGESSSFDPVFYRWLLPDPSVSIIPVISAYDVEMASKRADVWSKISSSIKVAGVTDADFSDRKSEVTLIRLALHEAESYLCHPDLLSHLIACLSQKDPVGPDDILTLIVEHANKSLLALVSKRVDKQLEMAFRPSVSRKTLQHTSTVEELVGHFKKESANHLKDAQQKWTEASVERLVKNEFIKCQIAINNRDTITILRLFEGKELLKSLLKLPGCDSPMSLLSATKKHAQIDNFPHLKQLSDSLNRLFI